ncbi:MAG: cysteine synthase A [Ruminococcus sp.]|nr:cysteine synthase A [Candidatus Copronaster equi]
MNIYKSISELVGRTPLLELSGFEKALNLPAHILAKLEYLNPAGSVKDRAALEMINSAEKSGKLKPGATIVEPTSGNTGIGIAAIAATRGYKVIITMPDTMSAERIKLMEAYGAKVILTEGELGMAGSIEMAETLNEQIPGSIIAGQFVNPANPEAHFKTTGPEIWDDTDGNIDAFVAGIGTGGTITGTGKYLKLKNNYIKIIGVEPASSPLLTKGYASGHKIQGIGANFVPEILDETILDEILDIKNEEAYKAAETVAKTDGILAGISSGAALSAAVMLAERPEYAGKNIVVLLPDTGDRYLSTDLFKSRN